MLFLDDKVGDEWPLTEREMTILKSSHSRLVQSLKIDIKMLECMFDCGCITQSQLHRLSRKHSQEKRNRVMLDVVKRRSLRAYRQFINCLKQKECNSDAALILEHAEGKTSSHYTLL